MIEVDLSDRLAVVTGASSGIGARTAHVMARCGARVLAVGRDEARLADTVAAIRRDGATASSLSVDLQTPGAVDEVVGATRELGDRVDILAMAAGHFASASFADTVLADLDDLWAVHVRAPFALTQALLPSLSERASVLFFSSTVAERGFAPFAAYSAVKGAVESLARALAVELAPGVRVNILVPGFTATPMLTGQFAAAPELESAILARTPVGFLDDGESIAHLAAYLSSDLGRYVDGARLVVDGGWVAQGWHGS